MVELIPITRANWRASLEVRVQPERLQWVASREPVALMLLAKSYIRPDGQVWHPFLLSDGGAVVGVVAVGTDSPGVSIPQVAWLHHFLIDVDAQGRGYGRASMREIGVWLRSDYPTITRIGLNVLRENTVAFALYASLGFEVVGSTLDDQLITMAEVADLA